MLKIDNLYVRYNENLVLNDLKVEFKTGKIHGIFGLNGSGKTTFFNAIYGFINHKALISLNGRIISKMDIGYLESTNFFYKYITGKEYLDVFNAKGTKMFDEKRLTEILKLPLTEFVENYSEGMKKKIALLGIIKLGRDVLLLDEPFNGLDIESVYLVKALIQQLKNKGITVLISSHIVEILYDLCDDFFVLENGNFLPFQDKEQFKIHCNNIYQKTEQLISATFLP